MKLSELGSGVESLPGVGPATAKQFARMNIFTAAALLSTYPRSYDDRSGVKRYVTEIWADAMEMLTPKSATQPAAPGATPTKPEGAPF